MFKNNKNGKILNVLLSVIAIFLIIFILLWVFVKNNHRNNSTETFDNNLNVMQEKAKDYFANDLPKELNDSYSITLKEMYELGLIDKLTYNNSSCDEDNSNISITKISKNEYQIKSSLTCGDKSDYLLEKIKATTTIKDTDGTTISDSDDITIETKENTETKEKTSTATCTGIVCNFEIIPVDCVTTYKYEYVKRTSSCPDGYVLENSKCVKRTDESIKATENYSKESVKTYNALVNTGKEYKVYTDVITTKKADTLYCTEGSLVNNKCEITTNRLEKYTYSCPSGYTEKDGVCYKYTNITSNTTYSCNSGYTLSGDKCLKTYNASLEYSSWGNPTYVQSHTKLSEYETATSKRVELGCTTIGKTLTCNYAVYSRSSYYYCSAGGTLSGTKCTIASNAIQNTTTSCPSGYTKDGNTCYIKANKTSNTTYSCPSGYTKDGNTCYIKTNTTKNTTYYCPTDYTEKDSKCIKTVNPSVKTGETTYSCPAGYNKVGINEDTICYTTKKSDDTYYCEDANATLKGKICEIKTESKFTGYSCPTGYTLGNDVCYKTTTETTDMIWSNAEYLYTTSEYVDGYQKTGVRTINIVCTRKDITK